MSNKKKNRLKKKIKKYNEFWVEVREMIQRKDKEIEEKRAELISVYQEEAEKYLLVIKQLKYQCKISTENKKDLEEKMDTLRVKRIESIEKLNDALATGNIDKIKEQIEYTINIVIER